jgi:nitrogen fixation protein FixH
MSGASSIPRTPRRGLRGAHVLVVFLGFFATIFLVNGVLIYEALSSFGGLETADAYRKGLAYTARIAEDAAQAQRGWRDSLAYVPGTQRVRVEVTDAAGGGVTGLVLAGEIGRPATDRFDRKLDVAPAGPGVYEAEAAGLEPGWWTVDIEGRRAAASDVVYAARERLWIRP